jgi:bacteriorhodopsin
MSLSFNPIEKYDNEKAKKKNSVKPYIKFTFMITYILLLTTATLTFIEAMRTTIPYARHVLNLETCISLVAGYFYGLFITQLDEADKNDTPIEWEKITKTRYIDWCITTPLMLLAICLVLGFNIKRKIHLSTVLTIVALNYSMLFFGYLGEFGIINRFLAMLVGFIPFSVMFYIIYYNFIQPKYLFENYIFYGLYIIVWSLYGIVYMLEESSKNICMNILDCIAKCLIGNGLFIYYANILVL